MQLFNLYRQDIRDLVGLTTAKMSHYHVVACLELAMTCTLLGPARLPSEAPRPTLGHPAVRLFESTALAPSAVTSSIAVPCYGDSSWLCPERYVQRSGSPVPQAIA